MLSSVAGIVVILVAMFPTGRSQALVHGRLESVHLSHDSCASYPGPPFCSELEAYVGEDRSSLIHRLSAASFVAILAAMCVVFALREFGYGAAAKYMCGADRSVQRVWNTLKVEHGVLRFLCIGEAPGGGPSARRVPLFLALGSSIVLGAVVALLGNTYLGEDYLLPGLRPVRGWLPVRICVVCRRSRRGCCLRLGRGHREGLLWRDPPSRAQSQAASRPRPLRRLNVPSGGIARSVGRPCRSA